MPVSIAPTRCVGEPSTRGPFFGGGYEITGRLRAPVRRAGGLLGLEGPRSVQAWPLLGTFPGIPDSEAGAFRILGLEGEWFRPASTVFTVSVGKLTIGGVVERSSPRTQTSQDLEWTSLRPIRPTASVLDVGSQSTWQNRVLFLSIAFGIAGSILAALVLESLRVVGPMKPQGALHDGSATENPVSPPQDAGDRSSPGQAPATPAEPESDPGTPDADASRASPESPEVGGEDSRGTA